MGVAERFQKRLYNRLANDILGHHAAACSQVLEKITPLTMLLHKVYMSSILITIQEPHNPGVPVSSWSECLCM